MSFSEKLGVARPYLLKGTGVLLALTGVLELAGYEDNPTSPVPANSCELVPSVSPYFAKTDAGRWRVDTGFDVSGVRATTKLPPGLLGVRVGFRMEGDATDAFQESQLVKGNEFTRDIKVKMALGDRATQFAVIGIAPEGSRLCSDTLQVDFKKLDVVDYPLAQGQLPWPNLGNVLTNLNP